MSKNTIGERLVVERNRLGIKQIELSRLLEITPVTMRKYEQSENPIPSDKLEALHSNGFDVAYLLTGKTADVGGLKNTDTIKNNMLESQTADVGGFDLENYAFIPLYNVEVSAGSGSFADAENIITHLAFTKYSLSKAGYQPANLACVIATGDSMLPTITPKETLMIDTTKRHADGGIFVLRAENQLYIKRLIHEKDGIRVISDNPVYPEWVLSKGDDFEIIGKKVWQARWD